MKPKNTPNRRRHAFTLIELLVVITIIAILAGLVLSQGPKLMENARNLQVQNAIAGLKTGISNYQLEYNRFPIDPELSTGDEDAPAILTDESNSIVTTLLGDAGSADDAEPNPLNPKGYPFCEFKIARNGMDGLANAQPPYRLVDLWGSPYYILMDTNLDQKIANPDLMNSDPRISQNQISPPPANHPTDVLIYSLGKDKTAQTGDDIVSWRAPR